MYGGGGALHCRPAQPVRRTSRYGISVSGPLTTSIGRRAIEGSLVSMYNKVDTYDRDELRVDGATGSGTQERRTMPADDYEALLPWSIAMPAD